MSLFKKFFALAKTPEPISHVVSTDIAINDEQRKKTEVEVGDGMKRGVNKDLKCQPVEMMHPCHYTKKQSEVDRNCPPSKARLGRVTWEYLHTVAAKYPEKPTEEEQMTVLLHIKSLSRVFPFFGTEFEAYIKQHPVRAANQQEFSDWMCNFHNHVNQKIGKPTFDCSCANKRWRDSWADDDSCGPMR